MPNSYHFSAGDPEKEHAYLRQVLASFGSKPCLFDDFGRVISYSDIVKLAESSPFQATSRRIVICSFENDVDGIAGYLAILAANAIPMLISPQSLARSWDKIRNYYKPDYLWAQEGTTRLRGNGEVAATRGEYGLVTISDKESDPIQNVSIALLLGTSGSTGSSKYVRLSHKNIWSNAKSISSYLGLSRNDIAVTSLPPTYSYGMSVIHSHVWVGARLAVTNKSVLDRGFWEFVRGASASSFAGVPYQYQILKKLGWPTSQLSALRNLTQAGGGLNPAITREIAAQVQSRGKQFFAMYGQTEASPRMAYVPADAAYEKAGTVGIAIPGGSIQLVTDRNEVITANNTLGELVYRGPNVCLGYAENREDLELGDVNKGVLYTGDLGERDSDNFFRIVGRRSRFIKIYGHRVSLEDIEHHLTWKGMEGACSGSDNSLHVFITVQSQLETKGIKKELWTHFGIPASIVKIYKVKQLPRNEAGKLKYSELKPELAGLTTQ